MAASLDDLVTAVRLRSGLRNNRLFSDSQIADLLTQGYTSLRDKMIVGNFAHWFAETFEFTLAGGVGGNTLDLTDVPRLEMVQGLDLLNGNAPPFTVPMLDSFANRNQYNNLWPLGAGWSFSGFLGRRYWLNGNELIVYPEQNAAGTYRLIYTPIADTFLAPITVNFDIDTNDVPFVPPTGLLPGTGSWALLNSGLNTDIPTDETVDMNLTFAAGPNAGFSGAYPILAIGLPPAFGRPTMSCNNLVSTAGFTGPAVGTGTYTYQPIGTISELPQALTQWQEYLILYASISIRTSRQQQTQELELQFQQVTARVVALTKQRSEGIRQAPITRGWGNGWSGGWR